MCGIAGAYDLDGRRDFPEGRLAAMCAALTHRGPDDQHLHLEPGLALGTRRLAIVDLGGGRQPLANEDEEIWVSTNGELFGYPEEIRELEGRGHRFRTQCDSEIWVHRYEELREGVFAATRGQFAVALWDRRARRLLLGRDRVGICPLFWARADGWLLWASEAKGILASGLVPAAVDPKGLDHVFTFYAASSTHSCFKGISSLPPGCYLDARETAGGPAVRQFRYWDLDYPDEGDELDPPDSGALVDELESLLRASIRRRLRGDVPVVGYLSGGVDSSLVLALASDEAGRPLPAFTIGLQGQKRDEHAQAAAFARHLGAPHTIVTMDSRGLADAYPDLIRHAEAPVIDTTCAATVRLAERVRQAGFKVALTGEGADEGLLGYGFFKSQKVQSRLGWPLARWVHRRHQSGLLIREIDGSTRRSPFAPFGGSRAGRLGSWEAAGKGREGIYSEAMWESLAAHDPLDGLDLPSERMARWHPLNRAAYIDYKVFLAGLLLSAKGDRSSMSASVETRPPFLDEEIVAFCARVHPRWRLRGLRGKWLLRQVAERRLPRAVAWRRKFGFRTRLAGSFLGPGRPPWVDELLSSESLARGGLFDPDGVAKGRARLEQGRPGILERVALDVALTGVIATQLWLHTFLDGGLADLPAWTPPATE
jgi:asparagine synthase (glutamine-hydrolysing)